MLTQQPLGKFIVLEGPDAVGKSTAVNTVVDYLKRTRTALVFTTRLPGGTPIGEEIRKAFKERANELSIPEQIHMLIKAKQHLLDEVVRPAIAQGHYIVCDRYVDSLLAYQWGGFANFDPQALQYIKDMLLLHGVDLEPDLKLVLDCDDTVSRHRLIADGREPDALDNAGASFRYRVQDYFRNHLRESVRGHTFCIDTSGTKTEVVGSIHKLLSQVL